MNRKVQDHSKRTAIIIAWAAVMLWMILIFGLSAQPTEKTNKLSLDVTERIMSTRAAIDIEDMDSSNIIIQMNGIIRKIAHFSLFLILGMLVSYALRWIGLKGYKVSRIAILVCILYAISDELHQMFVPGRNAALTDILIDVAGSAVGIVIFIYFSKMNEGSK